MSWYNPLDWGTGSEGSRTEPELRARVEAIRRRIDAGDPTLTQTERNLVKNFDAIYGNPRNDNLSPDSMTYLGEEIAIRAREMTSAAKDALTFTGQNVLWPLAIIAVVVLVLLYLPRGNK